MLAPLEIRYLQFSIFLAAKREHYSYFKKGDKLEKLKFFGSRAGSFMLQAFISYSTLHYSYIASKQLLSDHMLLNAMVSSCSHSLFQAVLDPLQKEVQ